LEEEVSPARGDQQVADLVDDQEAVAIEEAQLFGEPSVAFGVHQHVDHFGKACSVDAIARSDGFNTQDSRQMRLASTWWAEETDDIAALDEIELGQCQDPALVERRLEREVEASIAFIGARREVLTPTLKRRLSAVAVLVGQQDVDGLDYCHLAALRTAHGMIKGFHIFKPTRLMQNAMIALMAVPRLAARRQPTAS